MSLHKYLSVLMLLILTNFASAEDIRKLSHHFDDSGSDISPWMFVPKENIKYFSTSETPGLVTVRQNGKNTDIKGILTKAIDFDDYALPWCFQLSLLQNQNAVAGHTGSNTQNNYAIGLNLAVTFSDPSLWPEDRTQRPPDTHDIQLLVVHLGSSGEVTLGLPQYTTEQHPERWLVWGRGDLGYNAMGDWKIPYWEIGNGIKSGGPANSLVYFECRVESPSQIGIGIKFDPTHDYNVRWIDFTALYGSATGIWEIGPIFSCDRWIPDVLCRNIPLERGPNPILFGTEKTNGKTN
mgnify:CR=1 FL=1